MEKWTLTWTKLVLLSEEEIKKLKDNLSGVYRLSYKSGEDYYVFYVGKSEDIKTRLLEHFSPTEKNVCIKNYLNTKSCFFRYAEITEIYVREATEKQAYEQYEPICNEKKPEGKEDVEVNLT